MKSKLEKEVQFLRMYAVVAMLCVVVLFASAFKPPSQSQKLGEIDFQRLNTTVEKDRTAIETTEEFLKAFMNLDWDRFRSFFAADATVFFPPSANSPERSNKKQEVEAVFRTVFDNARKQKSSPPYLKIQPRDMRVQLLGDVAIVTFHLDDPDSTGRRTIVLRHQGRRWLIVHLHASGISVKETRR